MDGTIKKKFLVDGELPNERIKQIKLRNKGVRYILTDDEIYKEFFFATSPLMS